MKTIIFLSDEGLVDELGWRLPFPLIPIGGNTIIGHTLDLFESYLGDEISIISPDVEVAAWLFEQYPDLSISCVKSWGDVGAMDGELLVINGRFLTNPNLPDDLPANAAITDENGKVTALWMKKGSSPTADIENWMDKMGADATAFPARFSYPVRTIAELQHANTRMLGLGYGSDDLVERSYAEEFMGLPPVFLGETAVVDHSIIGPYAHIGANAHIKSSIIRNSIISAGAIIENCILDGAIIGENIKIIGEGQAII